MRYHVPTKIVFGSGVISQLKEIVQEELKTSCPFLVTDQGIVDIDSFFIVRISGCGSCLGQDGHAIAQAVGAHHATGAQEAWRCGAQRQVEVEGIAESRVGRDVPAYAQLGCKAVGPVPAGVSMNVGA